MIEIEHRRFKHAINKVFMDSCIIVNIYLKFCALYIQYSKAAELMFDHIWKKYELEEKYRNIPLPKEPYTEEEVKEDKLFILDLIGSCHKVWQLKTEKNHKQFRNFCHLNSKRVSYVIRGLR